MAGVAEALTVFPVSAGLFTAMCALSLAQSLTCSMSWVLLLAAPLILPGAAAGTAALALPPVAYFPWPAALAAIGRAHARQLRHVRPADIRRDLYLYILPMAPECHQVAKISKSEFHNCGYSTIARAF